MTPDHFANEITQYILAQYGRNITPDDKAQLKDTALTMIGDRRIRRGDSIESAADKVMLELASR